MHRNPRFGILIGFLVCLAHAAALNAAPASTQATQPATRWTILPAVAPEPPPPSAPFSLAEAATEAESVAITLRNISADLNNDQQTEQISEELPILTSEINGRLDESYKLLASGPSLHLLGMQEDDWTAIQQNLDQWKKDLLARHARLQSAAATMTAMRTDWDREAGVLDYWSLHSKATDLLDAARTSIDSTRDLIGRTQDVSHKSLIELFGLQQAVNQQTARVLDVLDVVRQARDHAFSRLLVKDSPSLWSVEELSKQNHGLVQEGDQSFGNQFQAVFAYMKRRWVNVAGHVALLMALFMGLRWLRAQSRQWVKNDPELAQAACVFASPVATAIVLSLTASARIYPQAPRLLWAMFGAAALVPTVLILRKLIDRRWFSLLNALVIFYFIDQLRAVVAVIPPMARVLLLFELVGGFLVLATFRRSARAVPDAGAKGRVIQFLSWIWLADLSLAALCDVLGYVSLANLLGDAALQSAYIAVVLYACTRIAGGLLLIAMSRRPLCELTMVRKHRGLIFLRLYLILGWIASFLWVIGVLASLAITAPVFDGTQKTLFHEFGYGQIQFSLAQILGFAFTIWLSVQISRFLRFVLEEDVYARFNLPGGIPYAISKMLNYVILLMGFFIAVSALGYNLTQFTILAGAFGVGLGFGMQNIVNNFVSGLILLFERPVKVGDVIQMDDTTGTVSHIGIRASVVRTSEAAEIIVPNGNLISNKVTNWTLSNRQRGIQIKLAVAASADPQRVIQLLKEAAAGHKLVAESPKPEAFLTTFSGDSFNYELHVWTNEAEKWIQIRSDLAVAIHAAMTRENPPLQ